MSNTYQIYLISDSTGETLDRIFLALKAQFKNIEYKVHPYSFTRTQNQIIKILETAKKNENSIILYTIVDNGLAKFLANQSEDKGLPCFGVLGNLILSFSKLLNQRASHQPSGQHVLNEEYYQRIEAIQFTMSHDDGNLVNEVGKSDIILLGVSRTSKTPTSIYLGMATLLAAVSPSPPINAMYTQEIGKIEALPKGAADTTSLVSQSPATGTTGLVGKKGIRCSPTPMGPMPGPPPPWGMQNVLCRFRWETSAPNLPGLARPISALRFAPST